MPSLELLYLSSCQYGSGSVTRAVPPPVLPTFQWARARLREVAEAVEAVVAAAAAAAAVAAGQTGGREEVTDGRREVFFFSAICIL